MRTLVYGVASFLVLTLALAVPAVAQDDLMAEVTAIGEKLEKAMLAGDFDAMMAFYVDDAISLPNYGPRMEGVDSFKKHHEEMTAAGMKILSFEGTPTDVWAAGDQVIEIGTFEITLKVPEMPEPVEDHGKYLTIWQRGEDGSLKVKVDTWNTDVNPMEMMGHEHMEHGEGHEHMEGHGH